MNPLTTVLAGLALAGAAASPGFAGTGREDPQIVAAAVQKSVESTVSADAVITLGPVTGAQYMPACPGALSVTVTGNPPYEEASVHCGAPDWTLYVSVTVAEEEAVVVAARPIAAGTPIQANDVKIAKEPVSLYAGRQVFYNTADLIGSVPVMSLSPGTIVTAAGITQPVVVQAGQSAAVTVHSGGLSLTINAIADETGHVGDTILMTNPASGQRFRASATRSGMVIDLN